MPVILCGFREHAAAAAMLVPKTAVHENYSTVFLEYYIRRPREGSIVQAETESVCMKKLSDCLFRFGVFRADRLHVPTALPTGKIVAHSREYGSVAP